MFNFTFFPHIQNTVLVYILSGKPSTLNTHFILFLSYSRDYFPKHEYFYKECKYINFLTNVIISSTSEVGMASTVLLQRYVQLSPVTCFPHQVL